MTLHLPAGGITTLLAPYPLISTLDSPSRLWLAALDLPRPVHEYLEQHGFPIRYRYVPEPWPIAMYQTVFATEPGSAEMPSAGRPFTKRALQGLREHGIRVQRITLHTGVSSQELGERPYPERYRVPEHTAKRINATKAAGGRIIAVGTTVVRALETVAAPDGTVHGDHGWTSLVVTPERGVRVVDALLTGWHEPDASHLLMLEAIATKPALDRSYAAATAHGYRRHEFGDLHLLAP
jgi:S-adenosylmethionine:tRNA ribosyltransferase-isomerase